MATSAVNEDGNLSGAGCPRPSQTNLSLHIRCVAGEKMVNMYLALLDGTVITLNRSSEDPVENTLRRLAIALRKRQGKAGGGEAVRTPAEDATAPRQNRGGKKRPNKATASLGESTAESGVAAVVISKRTGEVIELDGATNGEGWVRLCGADAAPAVVAVQHPIMIRVGPFPFPLSSIPGLTSTTSAPAGDDRTGQDPSNGDLYLRLDVVLNPPAVTSLECVVASPLTGFSILPRAEVEFGAGVDWEWLREIETKAGDARGDAAQGGGGGSRKKGKKSGQRSAEFVEVVSRSSLYTPGEGDVGRRLMVRCTPRAENGLRGRPVARIFVTPVRHAPEPGLLTLRRRWLEERGDGAGDGTIRRRLRVVCYNILADMYCTSAQADEVLYPHCPRAFREAEYRMQVALREVRSYGADLLMFQVIVLKDKPRACILFQPDSQFDRDGVVECDAKAFERYFVPYLEHDGYEGLYLNKTKLAQLSRDTYFEVRTFINPVGSPGFASPDNVLLKEGEALFYRRSAFALESTHDFAMCDAIPQLKDFEDLLKAFPALEKIVVECLTTVAQVAVLRPLLPPGSAEDATSVRLIVANTHLYFHPNAAHIRVMQLVALTERVREIRAGLIARGFRPAIIMGGDLNSPPRGPVRYLMGELLGPDSELWRNVKTFEWGDRFFDDEVGGASSTTVAKTNETPGALSNGQGIGGASPFPSSPTGPPCLPGQERPSQGEVPCSDGRGRDDHGSAGGGVSSNGHNRGRSLHPVPVVPVPYLRSQLGLELATGTPAFTNFTPEFTETLDYVFIEPGSAASASPDAVVGEPDGVSNESILCVEGKGVSRAGTARGSAVAPMPEEETLRAATPGLPTETFPSDHVSLVVDLELCTRG